MRRPHSIEMVLSDLVSKEVVSPGITNLEIMPCTYRKIARVPDKFVIDIQESGLSAYITLPDLPDLSPEHGQHIPLLARGTLFNRKEQRPPRLPFSKRTGNIVFK